jgi:tRNA threonylcarbamoyladenosine biosynthesis protein TsaE
VPGTVIALSGPLAAGKTTLAKGIARGLGIDEDILSPTFTLINDYPGRLSFHHMDAYRLRGKDDFLALGAEEIMADGGVSVIEWSERVETALPPGRSRIAIAIKGDEEREIEIEGPMERSLEARLAAEVRG